MHRPISSLRQSCAVLLVVTLFIVSSAGQQAGTAPISFELKRLQFRLESDESPARNAPETMAGGVAVFDYNGDGRPDIFFANGAPLATGKKSDPKYSESSLSQRRQRHLYRCH